MLNNVDKTRDEEAGAENPTNPDPSAIANELELILASRFFRSTRRSQQFLRFVVEHRLGGDQEGLKERTIGNALYNRDAAYATGEDSVVRVQAGEVRRRLEQYYRDCPSGSRVQIELPVGSYSPVFRWRSPEPPESRVTQLPPHSEPAVSDPVCVEVASPEGKSSAPDVLQRPIRWRSLRVIPVVVVLGAALAALWYLHARASDAELRQFWSPALAASKPVLIGVPKPVLYRPSNNLYLRNQTTPGEFDNEVDRMLGSPHLKPDDTVHWAELTNNPDFGVGKGDVVAMFRIIRALDKLGKDSELRIGNDYGWDDLHHAPAALIGAFSNQWAMKELSGLHFGFVQQDIDRFGIQEQGSTGRFWHPEFPSRASGPSKDTGLVMTDYGLVTRLVNGPTGQFSISIAGITGAGSEAAADVATSEPELKLALRKAPPDRYRKNVQIVVKTNVVNGVVDSPQIVAVYVW